MIRLLRRDTAAFLPRILMMFFAVAAAGLAGCATVAPPAAPVLPAPAWESGHLLDSLAQRDKALRSVRALARVDYAGPEGKQGFQEAVLVQRPANLRLETLTPLGAVLIVTANDQEIIGYHPREGVFVRGQRSKENLRRYTQMPLELEEITALLIGLPPLAAGAQSMQEGNVLIFSANGRNLDRVEFASHQPVPTKWERLGSDGKVELSARFSDYISTPAGAFSSRIVFEAHRQKMRLEIRYQEPELNAAIPAELFSQRMPPHVKELPIEAVGG
ncbi:MAG TPA: hypothetical protein VLA17_05135 [Candidatus Limnocylindria bacterium]|nr:hypothetical protein [Candidatus Limnocylindria bacterium]